MTAETKSLKQPKPSPAENSQAVRRRRWWRSPKLHIPILVLVCLLIAGRLVLPFAIKDYVNRQLGHAGDYSGRVGDITVHLWRGAYRIHGVQIFKKTHEIKEPFFSARALDLSIEWKELFHGSVVGSVVMEQPRVNFVSGPTEQTSQTGKNTGWDEILKSLFPFKLNRLEIKTGEVHFANHYSKPPVDIYLSQLGVVATNLTNARDLKNELPSGIVGHAKTLGNGRLDLDLRLNLLAARPTYEMTCQLTNVDMTSLNEFLRAYGKFDVARGNFSLYGSVASKDGNYEGYFKTIIENLSVFNWEKDKHKDVFGVVWEGIVSLIGTVFRNHSHDTVATKIPISGTYGKNEVGIWSAAMNLLRNAFIEALVPKVDEKVTVRDAEKKAQKSEEKAGNPQPPASSSSTSTNSPK